MEGSLPRVLVFEDLCQESLSISIKVSSIRLYRHSSSMNCIKLPSNLRLLSSWTPISSLTIGGSLSHAWALEIDLITWTGYKVLCLVTARLDKQTLVHILLTHINRLPCIFCLPLIWILTCCIWNNSIDISASFISSGCTLGLVHQPHWQLVYIDRRILICRPLVYNADICVLNFIWTICCLLVLNGPESTMNRSCFGCSTFRCWRDDVGSARFFVTTFLYFCGVLEKLAVFFVLGIVKSIILQSCNCCGVISYTCNSACSNTCDVSSIAIFSLNRLGNSTVQIYHKVFIDGILIRWFTGLSNLTSTSSLCSSLICNSFILLLLVVSSFVLLNRLIIIWITSFLGWIDCRSYKFIYDFSTLLKLFWI